MNGATSSGHDADGHTRYVKGVASTGHRIREKRLELGLSQEKLARELEVSRNTVGRWETEDVVPEGANLEKLARALGVTTDWILRGDRRTDARPAVPYNPPHWDEFVERYAHLDAFTQAELEEIKGFGARVVKARSWVDFERIAETVRMAQPSATFEAKRARRREP